MIIRTSDLRIPEELSIKIRTLAIYIKSNTKNDKNDVEKVRNIIYKHAKECNRLCTYAKEMITSSTESRQLSHIDFVIKSILNEITKAETMQQIRDITNAFYEESYELAEQCSDIRSWNLYSMFSQFRSGNSERYKIDKPILKNIAKHITSEKPLTMFSIQCRRGEDERDLADALIENLNVEVKTYGLDNEANGARSAKEVLDRVILGSIKGSTVSNEVFDIVFASPTITLDTVKKASGKLAPTNEEIILNNSLRYLKPNGLFIFTIPFYELSPAFALYLSRELRDINVFKHNTYDECRDVCKFITIIGRKSYNLTNSSVFKELTNLNYNELPTEPVSDYCLNLPSAEIKIFRGSVLDNEELDEIIKTDGLYEDFFSNIENQNKPSDKAPLLPFNIGQIGLVLSSGSLDGVVEESLTVKHAIKGMTIKETETETEQIVESNGSTSTKSTETVRNKVKITALGADGTLYNLT